ncbi:MAG: hypothetical protein ACFB0E_08515 [Leptolyngbyaceae cyanobacterium]
MLVATTKLMNAVYVSIVSAIIAFSSFLFNFLTYRARLRLEQASNAAKLHEKWWGDDYYSARRRVYSLTQDWNTGESSGEKSTAFLDYFSSPEDYENRPDELEDFAKLVFFFSDLNVYIDEKLISTRLAYRLLGDSQYAWFQDFICEVRTRIESRQSSDSAKPGKVVRWVAETRALEKKFDSFRIINQRKKSLKFQVKRRLRRHNNPAAPERI